jgi:redox-sensitive bicupin YhaK (pirin superfamily)
MEGIEEPPRELRVLSSRIELEDVLGRVLFPSPLQGPWLPFLRFADTITSGGGDDPEGHTHQEEEALNYVIAGRVDYDDETGHRSVLGPGAVELLTAHDEARHKVMGAGQAPGTRWLSVVVRCPPTSGAAGHRFQVAPGPTPIPVGKTVVERLLVGPDAAVESEAGLECTDIDFRRDGRCVCPVGGDRRAVAYVFDGAGFIDRQPVETGVGVLIENLTKITIQAKSGARVLVASVPRRPV